MNRTFKIIIGIIAGILVLLSAIGGLGTLGMVVFIGQAKTEISQNATVREKVGVIEDIDFEFFDSMEYSSSDTFVFSVKGSKGSGQIVADFVTVNADTEKIASGTLILEDGGIYDLQVE